MSLRVRLVLVVGSIVAVTVATVAGTAWWLATREIREPTDDLVDGRIALLVDGAVDAGIDATASGAALETIRVQFDLDLLVRELYLQYLDESGEPASTVVFPVSETDRAIARGEVAEPVRRTVTVDGTELRVVTAPMPGGAVSLGEDVTQSERAIDDLRNQLLVAGGIGVLAAAAIALVVARRIALPVARVADAAEQLAAGRDAPGRIEVDGTGEIGRLAESFNRMLSALEVSREQQRRLVADASHELRTPLTSLRMKIEHLGRNPDLADDSRQALLDDAVTEFVALSDLVNELVVLATDSGEIEEQPETVPLGRLVTATAERAARRTGRSIEVQATDAEVELRPRLVDRALANLLDNADKYSPEGEPIRVVATAGRIEVHDRGSGIPLGERDAVFDRFYRGPGSRNRTGSGIGLAIVRRVAELHGGEVFVGGPPEGGAVVGFTLSGDDRPPSDADDGAQ
ncbi:MAG: HAMP domain-containing sensor histidine kinase [Acidimicrobiales bacterium]